MDMKNNFIKMYKALPVRKGNKLYIVMSSKEIDYMNKVYGTNIKVGDTVCGAELIVQDRMPTV